LFRIMWEMHLRCLGSNFASWRRRILCCFERKSCVEVRDSGKCRMLTIPWIRFRRDAGKHDMGGFTGMNKWCE
jgi:hypothetical protein